MNLVITIINIKCCTGKNLVNKGKKCLSFDVVTKLLRWLEDRGHHLFFDNYCVTLELIDNLQKNQFVTTFNMRRACFFSSLKDLKVNKSNKFMKMQVILIIRWLDHLIKEDKTLIKWKDKSDVYVISNIYNGLTLSYQKKIKMQTWYG